MATEQRNPITSFVSGVSDRELLHCTVDGVLRAAAGNHPDRPALVVRHQKIRYTYEDLDREVESLARGLVALGLARGDRIGIWAPNGAEWVVTMFAAARAGLVLVDI